MVTGNV